MTNDTSSELISVLRSILPHVHGINGLEGHLLKTAWAVEDDGLPEFLTQTMEGLKKARRTDTKFHVLKVMGKQSDQGKIWALLHQSSIRDHRLNTIALYDFEATTPIDSEAVSTFIDCQPRVAAASRPHDIQWLLPGEAGKPPRLVVSSNFESDTRRGACISVGALETEQSDGISPA